MEAETIKFILTGMYSNITNKLEVEKQSSIPDTNKIRNYHRQLNNILYCWDHMDLPQIQLKIERIYSLYLKNVYNQRVEP